MQTILQKVTLLDLLMIEKLRIVGKNLHHWLTTGILQIHHLQYHFFLQILTINTQTKEQIRIFSPFRRKFFIHNYHLIWDLKFQDACPNFPSQFSKDYLLNFLSTSENHHLLFPITFVISLSLILPTSPIVIVVSIKVLNFLLL